MKLFCPYCSAAAVRFYPDDQSWCCTDCGAHDDGDPEYIPPPENENWDVFWKHQFIVHITRPGGVPDQGLFWGPSADFARGQAEICYGPAVAIGEIVCLPPAWQRSDLINPLWTTVPVLERSSFALERIDLED